MTTTFTALNGASAKPTEGTNGTTDLDPPNGQSSAPETRSSDLSNNIQRDSETRRSTNHDRLPFPGAATHLDVEISHKRKRSITDSPRREGVPSPPERRGRDERLDRLERPERLERLERSEELERTERTDRSDLAERTEQHGPARRQSESRDGYSTPQKDAHREQREEGRDSSEQWHSQQGREERNSSYEGPYSAGPVSAQSDDQGGDLLRRAGSQGDSVDYGDHGDNGEQSPDADDHTMYSGQYSHELRRDGVIQSDPKKRKRNFSNRTKTGCLTCRRRKKKCDEQKPECNNCMKGGFVCLGYPQQKGGWSKPESKPTQVNIESKDPNYVPPGAYGMPQQPPYNSSQPLLGQQPKRDPLPYNRGQPGLRITPPQGRPLKADDDRPTASTLPSASIVSSSDNKLSALSVYTTATSANVFPTPVSAATMSAFSDRTPKEYQRVPPLHDLTRTEPDQQQPPPPPPPQSTTMAQPPYPLPRAGRTATPPTASSLTPQAPSVSGVQATAQLALSHTHSFAADRPRHEKEEMIQGRLYYPFDKELVLERERCNAACWRFNNSTNPNLGVSPAERARLFRDILHPREGVHLSPTMMSPVTHTGRVGEDVTVEAPFTCDYGYNIHIGNNVSIGRNCLINDVCEVRIGKNVIISPNVCIYTGTCSTDPRRRDGNRGTQYGKPVTIEDDVWIAANVIILPGVRIGRGSTVAAGSIVTRDVATFSLYMGVKAGHRRGIAFVP